MKGLRGQALTSIYLCLSISLIVASIQSAVKRILYLFIALFLWSVELPLANQNIVTTSPIHIRGNRSLLMFVPEICQFPTAVKNISFLAVAYVIEHYVYQTYFILLIYYFYYLFRVYFNLIYCFNNFIPYILLVVLPLIEFIILII